MPKFIGRDITDAKQIHDNARPTAHVRLSYAQAMLLPSDQVVKSLNTTDKGGPKCFGKRWFNWYATPAAILACEKSTPKMRAAAKAFTAVLGRQTPR